ncbi:DUF6527 family protein [Stieleria tagensis]|uniref:DUF6527 family protein n=1 Tax=Stieleria tagensis TaxID=2956795 RepID=UPI0036F1990E
MHLCCCGCSREVVTPFSPTDWKLVFDGESVSLSPSVGNWNFPCRSHYIIRQNRVLEAGSWSDDMVRAEQQRDKAAKAIRYGAVVPPASPKPIATTPSTQTPPQGVLTRIRRWWSGENCDDR